MLFSSITFLFAFLALVLILYFIVPRKVKNLVLLVFSLVFYAWGEAVYIILMIASIAVAYVTGIFADRKRENSSTQTALASVVLAVVWNIGLLLFFKYTDFFITNANSMFGFSINLLGLSLPIGISS